MSIKIDSLDKAERPDQIGKHDMLKLGMFFTTVTVLSILYYFIG